MRRVLLILLIPFILLPSNVFAGAPKLPPEIINPVNLPNGKPGYYVKNPNAPKPNLKLVPPRETPPSPGVSPKLRTVVGMVLQVFLTTDTGQRMLKDFAGNVDKMANALGQQIQNLSDLDKAAFIAAYDAAQNAGDHSIKLGTDLYNKFQDLMRKGSIQTNVLGDVSFDSANNTATVRGFESVFPASPVDVPTNYQVLHILGGGYLAYSGYWGTHMRSLWGFGFDRINNNYVTMRWDIIGNSTSTRLSTGNGFNFDYALNWFLDDSKGFNQVLGDNYDLKAMPLPYKDNDTGSIKMPTFPDLNKTPGIAQDDAGIKYWEIPNPYSDEQTKIDFVPVDNPTAEPIPDVIVIDKDGFRVDPKTGGRTTPEPDFESVPDNPGTGSDTDPTPDQDKGLLQSIFDWLLDILNKIWETLKSILDAILSLPGKLMDGLLSLFVPKAGFYDDFWDGTYTKFNEKVPLFKQLLLFFESLHYSGSAEKPQFLITMPKEWGGGTYSIIDFSYFDDYKLWILNFIRFSAWFLFLKRLFNRLPRMVE